MELTDEDIREYQEIWKEEFGETLTAGEAQLIAGQLLRLYEFLAERPPPVEPSPE